MKSPTTEIERETSSRLMNRTVLGLLAAGLLLRLALLGLPGFRQDIQWYVSVSDVLRTEGLLDAYGAQERVEGQLLNYFPFALEILWLLSPLVAGAKATGIAWLPGAIHRIPAVFADIGIAWLLYLAVMCRRRPTADSPSIERIPRWIQGRTVLLLALFNPGPLYVGAGYGQMDSVGLLGVVAAVFLCETRRPAWSGFCMGLAIGFKMQPIIFLPALLFVVWLREGAGGVLKWIGGALAAVGIPLLPFIATHRLGIVWSHTIGANLDWSRHLTTGAFNAWGLARNPLLPDVLPLEMFFDGNGTLSAQSPLASLTYRRLGFLLFGLGHAGAMVALWKYRAREGSAWWFLAAVGLLFFSFTTRVHERYLLAAILFAMPVVAVSPRLDRRVAYGLLSTVLFVNLLVIAPPNGTVQPLETIPRVYQAGCGILLLLGCAWLVLPPLAGGRAGWSAEWRRAGAWTIGVLTVCGLAAGVTWVRSASWRTQGHLQDLQYAEPPVQGWGLTHRGLSNGRNVLQVDGRLWARGLGTHASSRTVFEVEGPTRLMGAVGVDDETREHKRGHLTAMIRVDGEAVFESEPLISSGKAQAFTIDLPNALNQLELVSDSGEAAHDDHADWLGMRLAGGSVGESR